jgi:D-sedoheptulose 7-phosphate isomerase
MISSAAGYFAEMQRAAGTIDQARVQAVADALWACWQRDGCVHVFGNGGSHANASHMVADFVKTAMVAGKRRLRALCMSDNLPMLTAVGNDISYADSFVFQLESYARRGDLAIAISCSGNSPNIVRASEWALKNGLTLVGLTGVHGGKLGALAQVHVNVASENFGVIEDLHMSIGHIAAQLFHHRLTAG